MTTFVSTDSLARLTLDGIETVIDRDPFGRVAEGFKAAVADPVERCRLAIRLFKRSAAAAEFGSIDVLETYLAGLVEGRLQKPRTSRR